jgi:hypothetical protein
MTLRIYTILSIAVSAASCAVEVGNPSGKKPKGNVNFSFLQSTSLSDESMTLPLESITLTAASGDSSDDQSTELSQKEVNLFSLDQNSTGGSVSAGTVEIVAGDYKGLVIKIPDDKDPKYRPPGGAERPMAMPDVKGRMVYLEQSITVAEGETTQVVIRIDPSASLQKESSSQYNFSPRGRLSGKPPGGQHKGSAPSNDYAVACAYAYGLSKIPPPTRPGLETAPGGRGESAPPQHLREPQQLMPPPPGPIGDRADYKTKADIVFDTTSVCSHAFTKAPIVQGRSFWITLFQGVMRFAFLRRTRLGLIKVAISPSFHLRSLNDCL